ncbi:MAG: hypothetical protein IJP92_10230 [Lachnospiraceae bacterium]|nr:hypothetical protein [Lachnospiraceae bacterium]
MTGNYLDMMADSLTRKIAALEEIEKVNAEQKKLFEQGDAMDDDAFDASVNRKGELIDEVDKLNDGFTSLFEKVKAGIGENKEKYATQIKGIQEQIRRITELSNSVQAQEARNKAIADRYFNEARRKLAEGKKTSGTAMRYYQTMSKSANIQPQFFDNKK